MSEKELVKEKEHLDARLREINTEIDKRKESELKEANYKKFLKRVDDPIIGKAHCELYNSNVNNFVSVYVDGNCGTYYYPKLPLTDTVHTYFHTVWTHTQRAQFQERLNAFVKEEINKIEKSVPVIVEMLGLASSPPPQDRDFLSEKLEEIKAAILTEQIKILDTLELKELIRFYNETAHAVGILKQYFEVKYPDNQDAFQNLKCRYCNKEEVSYQKWLERKQCDKCKEEKRDVHHAFRSLFWS